MHSIPLPARRFVLLSCTAVLMYFAALPATTFAADVQPAGRQVPPELAFARVVGPNSLEVLTVHERIVMRTVQQANAKNTGIFADPQFESVPIAEEVIARLKLSDVEARRMDGSLVPGETLASQLASFKPVLLCRSPNRSAAGFKSLFDPQTIVLTVRTWAPVTAAPQAVPQKIGP